MRNWWWVVMAAMAACGGDDDSGGARTGSLIALFDGADSGHFVGWFYDHDLPGELARPSDGCQFYARPFTPVCDPACGDGQTCAPDGTCADSQRIVSVGSLTVSGISSGTVEIAQSELGTYELHQQSSLLDGPTRVDIAASGSDEFAGFEIGLDAPLGPLTPEGSSEPGWPALASGEDLELTWGSGDPDSRVRVSLVDDFGAAWIWCDAGDTGSLTVPGQLIADFLAAADFSDPNGGGLSVVERYRRTSLEVDDDHRIDLVISSGLEFWAQPDL